MPETVCKAVYAGSIPTLPPILRPIPSATGKCSGLMYSEIEANGTITAAVGQGRQVGKLY